MLMKADEPSLDNILFVPYLGHDFSDYVVLALPKTHPLIYC